MVTVDEIELAIARLDKVISDHGPCGAILEIVAKAAVAQRAVVIGLKQDTQAFRITVVLIDTVDDASVIGWSGPTC